MTTLLYMEDCYMKSCNATIDECEGTDVVLDETCFYPSGGGQPTDRGRIVRDDGQEFQVVMVKKRDENIIHTVDKEGLQKGDNVHCSVNWDRRYLLMKYHTAAHVLSGIICNETSALITGNQLEEEKARIDFNLENFDKEQILTWEAKANEVIKSGSEVIIQFLPREDAEKIPSLVKLTKGLPESIQNVRTIEIKGLDIQACGGTHLKNVAEIGSIKIVETKNKGANNRRLYFTVKT